MDGDRGDRGGRSRSRADRRPVLTVRLAPPRRVRRQSLLGDAQAVRWPRREARRPTTCEQPGVTEEVLTMTGTAHRTFLIVGAGLAGTTAAEALRTDGFDGRIVLLGDETTHPYDRPPLSKDYLQDKSELDKVFLHPDAWYAEQDIELRLETRVTAIDRNAHKVSTAGTASSSGWARRSLRSPAKTALPPGCGSPTAAWSRLTRWWSRWASSPTPSWPRPRA